MKVLTTSLKEVLLIEQDVFGDRRGYFMETYQKNVVPFMIPTARAEFYGPIPQLVLTGLWKIFCCPTGILNTLS